MIRHALVSLVALASLAASAAPTCVFRETAGGSVRATTVPSYAIRRLPHEPGVKYAINDAFFFLVSDVSDSRGNLDAWSLDLAPTGGKVKKSNRCAKGAYSIDGVVVGESIVCPGATIECDYR